MKTTFKISIFLLAMMAASEGHAQIQQVVNSAGGAGSGKPVSVDWSIGELALVNVMESADSKVMVTNGFLQPIGVNDHRREKSYFQPFDLRLYPNPTKDLLELDFFTFQKGHVAVIVYNDAGRLVHNDHFAYDGTGESYQLHMKNYPAGVYTVYVYLDPAEGQIRKTGTYRVIKINN